jgi:hypothetical protein
LGASLPQAASATATAAASSSDLFIGEFPLRLNEKQKPVLGGQDSSGETP